MEKNRVRLSLVNHTDARPLPAVFITGDVLHDFLGARRPYLTAKRLSSNQTFCDFILPTHLRSPSG